MDIHYRIEYTTRRGKRRDAGIVRHSDYEETLEEARRHAGFVREYHGTEGDGLLVGEIVILRCEEVI